MRKSDKKTNKVSSTEMKKGRFSEKVDKRRKRVAKGVRRAAKKAAKKR